MDKQSRQEQVAQAAGLSSLHGGEGGRTVVSWEGECTQEAGTRLTVSRIWDGTKGEPPTHLPLECPVCQEEHMIPRR